GEEQFRGDDAERGPDRAVGGNQRNHQRGQREREVGVDRDRRDVQDQEGADEDAAETMNVFQGEPGPVLHRLLAGHQQPDRHVRRQEDVRDHAAGTSGVPVDRARGQMHGADSPMLVRHAAFAVTSSSAVRNRAGIPFRSSHAGPRSLSRKPAFAAMSAARHEAPHTVTWDQGVSAGREVRGSIRWCWTFPPRSHHRFVLPLVASAPSRNATDPPPGSATVSSPRVATSPPAETNPSPPMTATASSTASDFTTPFRSNETPASSPTKRPSANTEPAGGEGAGGARS